MNIVMNQKEITPLNMVKTVYASVLEDVHAHFDEYAKVFVQNYDSYNEEEMKEAMANVKTGQVTFAIRDTVIDDVEVKKDQFIALFGKKIVSCNKDKIEVTLTMLSEMVDESSSIITLIYGEDATSEEVEKLSERIQELYPDVDLDVREGNQPVYSFIIAVE